MRGEQFTQTETQDFLTIFLRFSSDVSWKAGRFIHLLGTVSRGARLMPGAQQCTPSGSLGCRVAVGDRVMSYRAVFGLPRCTAIRRPSTNISLTRAREKSRPFDSLKSNLYFSSGDLVTDEASTSETGSRFCDECSRAKKKSRLRRTCGWMDVCKDRQTCSSAYTRVAMCGLLMYVAFVRRSLVPGASSAEGVLIVDAS